MKEEKIIVNENSEYPLDGILTIPDVDNGTVPAVVFVHGSGPSDKDEKVYNLTPFKDLAHGLAQFNIASIRYDKRTFVYARKMLKQNITVKEETIDDALLATNLLKNNKYIDSNRIFIVGHSMGAMLAPRIDSEGANCAGIIMLAGSPYRLEDIVIRQIKQAANSKGILMKFIANLEDKIYTKKFNNLYELTDEQAKKKKFAGNMSLYYFKEMGRKTSVDYLKEIDKPVLIMQGGKDFQVLTDDFNEFKKQLVNKNNIQYKYYENLNHLFMNGIYNDILKASKEYKVKQSINEDVIRDIAEFINNVG